MSQAVPKDMNRADASRNLGHARYQLNELNDNIAKLKRSREEVPSYLLRQQMSLKNEICALEELLGDDV